MSLPSQSDFIEKHLQHCEAPADFRCTICQCEDTDQVVRIDHSGHSCWFHKPCLTTWFTSISLKRGTCPNDRIALFEPNALVASQLDSTSESTLDPAVLSARQTLNDIRQTMEVGDTPMEMAFNYREPLAIRLRLDARRHADALDSLQGNTPRVVAWHLRRTLVEWAGVFMHSAPHAVQHELDAVGRYAEALQSQPDSLSEDEMQQVSQIVGERQAAQDALPYASRTDGLAGASDVYYHNALMAAVQVALATVYADRMLTLLNQTQALILQIGRLHAEHAAPVPVATGATMTRPMALEEPDELRLELAREIDRQLESLDLE
ncbi:uncharacterized protein N0V89_001836 [Didymosphaeria variabile]|uniref:RING-type domain-containing protein n=1 Tax=Didymosphaeria variabile TaxID=1932322 RepID=A0A9W9CD00_9PLEO|nr:uncharacterized protein N0V89_001836 [Didymosphaeria variabile]KAJ4357261.1 hypothetical protein N0V89_001836 [Didymosphaeria variabile]